jgi:hypothetical protein
MGDLQYGAPHGNRKQLHRCAPNGLLDVEFNQLRGSINKEAAAGGSQKARSSTDLAGEPVRIHKESRLSPTRIRRVRHWGAAKRRDYNLVPKAYATKSPHK